MCQNRETREEWPLLTVVSEMNGALREKMKGVLLCLVRRTPCAVTIHFWPVLAALVSPVQNIIFLGTHFLILLVLSA